MPKIILHKPDHRPAFTKEGPNKGWIIQFSVTKEQLIECQPLLAKDAVAKKDLFSNSYNVYESLDNFMDIKAELIKASIIDPRTASKTRTYKDINTVVSHRSRTYEKALTTVKKIKAESRKAKNPNAKESASLGFYYNEDQRGKKDKEGLVRVTNIPSDLLATMPDHALCSYSQTGKTVIFLSTKDFAELKPELEKKLKLGYASIRYVGSESEVFEDFHVTPKSEFVFPSSSGQEFAVADIETGEVFFANNVVLTGHRDQRGEAAAMQQIQYFDGKEKFALSYAQANRFFRPATELEAIQARSTKNNKSKVSVAANSLLAAAKNANRSIAEALKEKNRLKKRLMHTPEKVFRFKLSDNEHVYRYSLADLTRAFAINPNFPLPKTSDIRISSHYVWLTEAGSKVVLDGISETPNINNPDEMLVPDLTIEDKRVGNEYSRSTEFHPYFMTATALDYGQTVSIEGSDCSFVPYSRLAQAQEQVGVYRHKNKATGEVVDVLLPDSKAGASNVIVIEGKEHRRISKPVGPRSVVQVDYVGGGTEWRKINEIFSQVKPPLSAIGDSVDTGVVFNEEDRSQTQFNLIFDSLVKNINGTELEVYEKAPVPAKRSAAKTRKAKPLELENAGQLGLFTDNDLDLATKAREVLRRPSNNIEPNVNTAYVMEAGV